jgi:hypothetical protein
MSLRAESNEAKQSHIITYWHIIKITSVVMIYNRDFFVMTIVSSCQEYVAILS